MSDDDNFDLWEREMRERYGKSLELTLDLLAAQGDEDARSGG